MLLSLVSAAVLLATPEPIKLASPGLTTVGLSKELIAFYGEHLAQRLRSEGLSVITARDIQTMLGIERQKKLLGCAEDAANCIAELGNALGVDATVTGEIAKLEGTYHVNLRVIRARDAQLLAAYEGEATGEKALLGKLNDAARAMAADVRSRLKPLAPAAPPTSPVAAKPAATAPPTLEAAPRRSGARAWAWAPAAAGAVLGGAAAFCFVQAGAIHNQLLSSEGAPIRLDEQEGLVTTGERYQLAGGVGLALGAAGLAAGAGMYLLGGDGSLGPQIAAGPNGWSVGIRGTLP